MIQLIKIFKFFHTFDVSRVDSNISASAMIFDTRCCSSDDRINDIWWRDCSTHRAHIWWRDCSTYRTHIIHILSAFQWNCQRCGILLDIIRFVYNEIALRHKNLLRWNNSVHALFFCLWFGEKHQLILHNFAFFLVRIKFWPKIYVVNILQA